MKNPWLKKNPLMSLWQSGANKVAGAVRGQAAATASCAARVASRLTAAAAWPRTAPATLLAPLSHRLMSTPRVGLRPARPPRGFKQSGTATFA